MPRRTERGFTLVEMLVALAVGTLFVVGILQLLDTSSELSRRESALSDAQENVRYATYSLVRTARMTGGGGLPFVVEDSGGSGDDVWVGGQILTQQSGAVTVDLNNVSIQTAPGTDVVILRGFFEQSPFFVSRTDVDVSGGQVTITESPGGTLRNPMDGIPASGAFGDRLVAFLGRGQQYAVAKVTNAGGTVADSGGPGGDVLTLPFENAGAFHGLNADPSEDLPTILNEIEVYRIGILDSYVFYVDPEWNLRRVRNRPGANVPDEVLAIDIGNLQAALGLDTNEDATVDTWQAAPVAATVAAENPVALRITVLGRTPFRIPDWTEPADTFAVEDLTAATVDREAKWRRMQVIAGLRNYIL